MEDRNFVFRDRVLGLDPKKFEEAGLVLARVHRKRNDGRGKTQQLMLIFVNPKSDLSDEEKRIELTDLQSIEIATDFLATTKWRVTSEMNGQAGHVPPHTMLTCGNPHPASGDTSKLNFGGHRPKMLRVALNMYPDMARFIPGWVKDRMRHGEKQALQRVAGELEAEARHL